jgi:nicotinate-nucleotide pyrophosphorylase (carboxylating)
MIIGEKAFEVKAAIHTILKCERLVLNCMQRMSGIATLTHTYVEKLKGYHTKILDTRKNYAQFSPAGKRSCKNWWWYQSSLWFV